MGGDHEEERVDLKKTKNVTLVTDIKNLSAPEAAVPVIVVDLIDRSLYIQSRSVFCVKQPRRPKDGLIVMVRVLKCEAVLETKI